MSDMDSGGHGGAQPSDLTPLPERTISDVATLKALSDPVRLRILETMVRSADEEWTVKRIAAAIGTGPTKLYHHIAILEERDLIRVAGTRVVSGIIETRYRIAQLGVRLDRSLLSPDGDDEGQAALADMVRSVFDAAAVDVAAAMRSGAMAVDASGKSDRGLVRQDLKRLSAAQVAELRARLVALLDEYDGGDATGDGDAIGVLVALYPVTDRDAPADES